MTSTIFSRSIAGDAFEYLVESHIQNVADLYDLDGETFLRVRGGIVETGEFNGLKGGAE